MQLRVVDDSSVGLGLGRHNRCGVQVSDVPLAIWNLRAPHDVCTLNRCLTGTGLAWPQICIPLQHQLLRISLHAARQAGLLKLSDPREMRENPLVGTTWSIRCHSSLTPCRTTVAYVKLFTLEKFVHGALGRGALARGSTRCYPSLKKAFGGIRSLEWHQVWAVWHMIAVVPHQKRQHYYGIRYFFPCRGCLKPLRPPATFQASVGRSLG